MKFYRFFKISLLILLVLIQKNLMAGGWQSLGPGIEYQDVANGYVNPWSHIHAFRIDLNQNKLSLVLAREMNEKYASADEFAKYSQALISINGGFFDDHFAPLGLRINHKGLQSPLKIISWWGVFYIKNHRAYLTSAHHFKREERIEFAIQSGPRLLVNGKIPPLKPGRAERSALGISDDGKVVIVVTDNAALSTTELAQYLKAEPLNCINALNLDGGSSSQLHAQIGDFLLNVHGFANVSDAVVVQPRS